MEQRTLSQASVSGLSELETSKVLKNTYLLLGMTIAFSAVVATIAMLAQVGRPPFIICIAGVLGLSYLVHKTADSAMGLPMSFLFTGFLGYILGPVVGYYLAGGAQVVTMALATTAITFTGLSAVVLISKKDFSFMTTFVHVGWITLLGVAVLGAFFDFSAFYMAISAAVVLLMCATILWQTSAIIHGGETNYIRATVTLYMSIYNLFSVMLMFFGMGDD
ncbi:MAG: modulator of FtsH protease [Limisphaerales bacterium]|jgi:modulator of FtsH protease